MKKNKLFIACDTTNISKIRKIIDKTQNSKLTIGYKFGLEFLNSKNGRLFVSKLKNKTVFAAHLQRSGHFDMWRHISQSLCWRVMVPICWRINALQPVFVATLAAYHYRSAFCDRAICADAPFFAFSHCPYCRDKCYSGGFSCWS